VPLRDLSEFHGWLRRESPSKAARSVARTFIAEIGDEPWRAPSVPLPDLSNQPEYEVRKASLPVSGEAEVHIWYVHAYATGNIDIIAVTNR
jgi:hypothetical protein